MGVKISPKTLFSRYDKCSEGVSSPKCLLFKSKNDTQKLLKQSIDNSGKYQKNPIFYQNLWFFCFSRKYEKIHLV